MRIFIFIILILDFAKLFAFDLVSGDILFQEGNNDFNDAIKEVTSSIESYNFSHCGIYYVDSSGKEFVIEAYNDGVVLTDISVFMNRYLTKDNKYKVVVGRLIDTFETLIPLAMQNALKYLGKEYDNEFDLENDAIYCSELIYFAFKDTLNKNIFETNPMTFIDANTNKIQLYWQEHFKTLHIPIPEGKEGINPGSISKSKNIKIVHYYY